MALVAPCSQRVRYMNPLFINPHRTLSKIIAILSIPILARDKINDATVASLCRVGHAELVGDLLESIFF